jgi:hypothetical protein
MNLKKTLNITIAILSLLFFLILCAIIGVSLLSGEPLQRQKRIYSLISIREKCIGIVKYYEQTGIIPPGHEYCGYVTDIFTSPMDYFQEPSIDPFNPHPTDIGIEELRYTHHTGGNVGTLDFNLKGAPFKYFTNGSYYFLVYSNGPDMDEDLNCEILSNYASLDELNEYILSNDMEYDITNGVKSSGDDFRIIDLRKKDQ